MKSDMEESVFIFGAVRLSSESNIFEGWGGGREIFWGISHFYVGHETFWLEEEFVLDVKNQNNDSH